MEVAHELTATSGGWLKQINTRQVGLALADMGGARRKVEDPLDLSCGIDFLPSIGDRLEAGDVIARIYCDRPDEAATVAQRIEAALTFSETEVAARDMIIDRVE